MNLQPLPKIKKSVKSKEDKDKGFDHALALLEKHENRYRNRDEIIKSLQKLLENIS